jgi:hypothetical protein
VKGIRDVDVTSEFNSKVYRNREANMMTICDKIYARQGRRENVRSLPGNQFASAVKQRRPHVPGYKDRRHRGTPLHIISADSDSTAVQNLYRSDHCSRQNDEIVNPYHNGTCFLGRIL